MSITATTPDKVKDQYQHAIPRFILRYFLAHPVTYKNAKQRNKVTRKAARKGKEPIDTVFYYDVNVGTVSMPSIGRCYGKLNLYRDARNTENVDHLEKKLSGIELEAACIMKFIHATISIGQFNISREKLSNLRKFLFIMHYRQDAMSSAYFHEDIPHNAPLAAWIQKYKERHPRATVEDIWRHGLKYYLDTPHQTIVTTGEKIRERYGADKFYEMLQKGVDPDLEEEWFAVDYERQANRYFLGVWEAAPGTEFVLGRNCFGLCEGRVNGILGAHKIYVVSPQIAIVLRDTALLKEEAYDPRVLTSCLAHIEINAPSIKYFSEKEIAEKIAQGAWTLAARFEYRRSAAALKDQFTIPITRLDESETYAVNEIVMMYANLHLDGAITYASPSAMLNTLQLYMNAHNTFVGLKKGLYRPLLQELLTMDFTTPSISPSLNIADFQPESETDMQLSLLLRMIAMSGGMEFSSQYNRAYLVYHMATMATSLTNPVTRDIRRIVKEAIEKMAPYAQHDVEPPPGPPPIPIPAPISIPTLIYTPHSSLPTPPSSPTRTSPHPKSKSLAVRAARPPPPPSAPPQPTRMVLVETLSKEESDLFFTRFGAEVDKLEVGEYTNDLLGNIIYEAAMIGIAEWMAETRPDILRTSFKPLLRPAEIL